jgi:hypothetical protein
MKKATKVFVQERNKFCRSKLVVANNVRSISGGLANKCFENAFNFAKDKKSKGIECMVLAGWIVQPFDREKNCTSIIQHWWNGDDKGNQFDTTPNIGCHNDYVLDFDFRNFTVTNFDEISSNVGFNLLLSNGQFELLIDEETMKFEKIDELKTHLLCRYI